MAGPSTSRVLFSRPMSTHRARRLLDGFLVAEILFACCACTSKDGATIATGTGSSSLLCSAGDRYQNVSLVRKFQSIATCHQGADQTLLVRVDSDTSDNVTFVDAGYHGPGTYSGNVEVYMVDPGTGCHEGVASATTVPADADACTGAPPAPCSVTLQGTATTTATGDLTLSASCAAFSFSRDGVCGTCTAQASITASIQDCNLLGPTP